MVTTQSPVLRRVPSASCRPRCIVLMTILAILGIVAHAAVI